MTNPRPLIVADAARRLQELAERWAETDANERAVFQPWLIDFCEALGVEAPTPPTGAKRELVDRHLETLALMGEVTVDGSGRYAAALKVA